MRFYFDLTDGTTTLRDEDGVDARDVQHAIEEAEQGIEEMRIAGELSDAAGGWRLLIRDEAGAVVATLPVRGG